MNNIEKQLSNILSRNWWIVLLRGLAAIMFGVLALLVPGLSLAALVLFFGAFVLVDGFLGVWLAIDGRKEYADWGVLLLWGLVGIGVGVLTFMAPGVTELVLLFFIATWAVATGVLEIVAAMRLRKEIKGEWLLILGGLLSVMFGVLFLARPGAGVLALSWLIGAYAFAFGASLVSLAFKMRGLVKELARG